MCRLRKTSEGLKIIKNTWHPLYNTLLHTQFSYSAKHTWFSFLLHKSKLKKSLMKIIRKQEDPVPYQWPLLDIMTDCWSVLLTVVLQGLTQNNFEICAAELVLNNLLQVGLDWDHVYEENSPCWLSRHRRSCLLLKNAHFEEPHTDSENKESWRIKTKWKQEHIFNLQILKLNNAVHVLLLSCCNCLW